MLFADTMAVFFIIVGILIAFPSLWLLCSGLFPEFVRQTAEAAEKSLWKSFFIGIPVVVVAVLSLGIVGKLPASFGQIGGVLTFGVWMMFAQAGVAGVARLIGKRLQSPADIERPWKGTLRGGVVLVLSYLLPLVGWFLILPGSVIIGAGSSVRACFARRKKRVTNVQPQESAESAESKTVQNVKLSVVTSDVQAVERANDDQSNDDSSKLNTGSM